MDTKSSGSVIMKFSSPYARLQFNKHAHSPLQLDKIKIVPNCKRSQHEIAGFVLIVLLVSVIGVIFLSLAFNKTGAEPITSAEISYLLESSMYVTSSCAINYVPQYRDMQDLIKECFKENRVCVDQRKVCEVLEEEFKEIIETGLHIDEERVNKAYSLNVYYDSRDEKPYEEIISFEKGIFSNCTAVVGGGHSVPVSSLGGGTIEARLVVCKG
jgi:hypothetical protein